MMATVVMAWAQAVPAADQAEEQARALALVGCRGGIGHDRVEPVSGVGIVAGLQRRKAEHLPRNVAVGRVGIGQGLEPAAKLGRVGRVDQQHGGAQPRQLAHVRVEARIRRPAHRRPGRPGGRIVLPGFARGPEAGQQRDSQADRPWPRASKAAKEPARSVRASSVASK